MTNVINLPFYNFFDSSNGVFSCTSSKSRMDKSIIQQLVQLRLEKFPADVPMGYSQALINTLSNRQLAGLPEAMIILIVQTWLPVHQMGIADEEIFRGMEKHRGCHKGAVQIPGHLTLTSYIQYRLQLEYNSAVPLSKDYIEAAILLVRQYYNKAVNDKESSTQK